MHNIEKIFQTQKSAIIAIDGMAGSGKTTLANDLALKYDCLVFHCDDYFLPLEKRNKTRCNESGGNIDYERMKEEIIDHLSMPTITYQPYQCQNNTFSSPITVNRKPFIIVEGAYAMHPYFKKYYDFAVFLKITPELQQKRIQNRNGIAQFFTFQSVWIPKENQYFQHYQIEKNADLVIQIKE